MDDVTAKLVAALAGATATLVVAILAYVQGQRKVTQDLQVEYDKDLRSRRIRAYSALMKVWRGLAKYPQLKPLSYEDILQMAESLSDWYYCAAGGLLLSSKSRDRYFDFQDGLKILLQNRKGELSIKKDAQVGAFLRKQLGRPAEWECPPALSSIAEAALDPGDPLVPMPVMEHLFKLASGLRTQLTEDVGSREPSKLEHKGVNPG